MTTQARPEGADCEEEARMGEDPRDVLADDMGARNLTRAEEIRLRYAAIVECSDDAIIAKTLDGVISAWNAAAERMFGYTEHESPSSFLRTCTRKSTRFWGVFGPVCESTTMK